MAAVNLWELITTVARKDLPNQEQCQGIMDACAKKNSFGAELTLEVDERGWWTVRVHGYGDGPDNFVELMVAPNGLCTVRRKMERPDMTERREVSF
jgi:hypothetical protein